MIAILLILCLILDIIVSSNWLVVREYTFDSSKVEESFKAVLISDLHGHEFGTGNEDLIRKIAEEEPDIIMMDGDFIDSGDSTDKIETLIYNLSSIAPVYFALGNQEYDYIETTGVDLVNVIEQAGAIVLDENYVDVTINGQIIRIGGLYDYAFANDGSASTDEDLMDPKVYSFLKDFEDTQSLTIMMSHRPDSFIFGEASTTWHIDLVVSGHTHGGQVRLPVLGGLWAPEQGFFPTYDMGMFEKDLIYIVITSGLGSKTEMMPRLNNPPEITIINFHNE